MTHLSLSNQQIIAAKSVQRIKAGSLEIRLLKLVMLTCSRVQLRSVLAKCYNNVHRVGWLAIDDRNNRKLVAVNKWLNSKNAKTAALD